MSNIQRIRLLDYARSFAVIAMIFYHFVYDLGDFGYVEYKTVISGYWKLFAQCIGSSFLFISGFSFWIMVRNEIDWIRFSKRLIILLLASIIISIVTFIQFGSAFIFFGILHLLAACTIFGLIIYRLPLVIIFGLGLILAFLPEYYFSASYYDASRFEPKYLAWTGLFNGKTGSVDFYAFMPWSAAYVLGLCCAKLFAKRKRHTSFAPLLFKEEKTNFPSNITLWIGRNSLLVYLIHQPILYCLFFVYGKVAGLQFF